MLHIYAFFFVKILFLSTHFFQFVSFFNFKIFKHIKNYRRYAKKNFLYKNNQAFLLPAAASPSSRSILTTESLLAFFFCSKTFLKKVLVFCLPRYERKTLFAKSSPFSRFCINNDLNIFFQILHIFEFFTFLSK